MFDMQKKLTEFHDLHVRPGRDERGRLADYREACLKRLKDGLKRLGEERGRQYRPFTRAINQGSYAMNTLTQHHDDDVDIDVAVIFDKDDLPTTALEARKRIADALIATGGNFIQEPEPRTNAVTVWYADGPHVDLAIYRESSSFTGTVLEHAGADWAKRDPEEITKWFAAQVKAKSPSSWWLPDVDDDQLRRIVRLVKMIAKTRDSWSLPGGMIITTLVAEAYQPDAKRDDVSLRKTLLALLARLRRSIEVRNPVSGASLTDRPQREAEVRRLGEKLEELLPHLDVLDGHACTTKEALRAWGRVFFHPYWSEEADISKALREDVYDVPPLRVAVGVANAENGRVSLTYPGPKMALPKGKHLRFAVENGPLGAEYRWKVTNSGDEAEAENDINHANGSRNPVAWERTAYKGIHTMTCEAVQNGRVVARGIRKIRVGR